MVNFSTSFFFFFFSTMQGLADLMHAIRKKKKGKTRKRKIKRKEKGKCLSCTSSARCVAGKGRIEGASVICKCCSLKSGCSGPYKYDTTSGDSTGLWETYRQNSPEQNPHTRIHTHTHQMPDSRKVIEPFCKSCLQRGYNLHTWY
ncbi:hypothetical protein ABW19_dt0204608 [Dactylella cylindrospora]|nr:hypothetical protein ABW19_dt0204608 [Dactylella cylindrospora]